MSPRAHRKEIILTDERLHNILKFIHIGDYIPITVKKELDDRRYSIAIQGVKLIAACTGYLTVGKKVYARVEKRRPQLVLKLMTHEGEATFLENFTVIA